MDWFEQLTGLSPDGGSGSYELAIDVLAVLIVMMLVFAAWKHLRR